MVVDAGIEFVRIDSDYYDDRGPRGTYGLHCPCCGRYCKLVTIRHHYNGWYNLMTQVTKCSKCGEVSIELV